MALLPTDPGPVRMITCQLYVNGSASQAELCRVFGVSKISMLRSVKLYREKGMAGFLHLCLSWAGGVDACDAGADAATP